MAWPVIGGEAIAALLLRIEFADGDAEFGPRLQHTRPGAEKGEVLIIGRLDQAIEHGIVERLPPVAIILPVCFHRRVVRL